MLGFVGLGSVVESAWLPALSRLAPPRLRLLGVDSDPARTLPGVEPVSSLAAMLSQPLQGLLVTTNSAAHWSVLQQALDSDVAQIIVEKPVVATLAEAAALAQQLADPALAGRVLALDHWTARVEGLQTLLGGLPGGSPLHGIHDILRIDGYVQERSGCNEQGEPCALNFATGEPDRRQLRHPDGVVLDTGTHVLAMLREWMVANGLPCGLSLHLRAMTDRLGQTIPAGDVATAEGRAELAGTIGGVPLTLHLDKYAGPDGGRKGLVVTGHSGWQLSLDRKGNSDLLLFEHQGQRHELQRPGALYDYCLAACLPDCLPGIETLGRAVRQAMTRRRLEEETLLLELQQAWRNPIS